MKIQWKTIRHIHFVGIKGIAMAALAVWAKEAGYRVTGSDVDDIFPSDEILAKANIDVSPFSARNVTVDPLPDLIIYTGAHGGRENDEVVQGEALGVPVLAHGEALGMIMADKRQISVAGSHGKTTTSAMIATILIHAKRDPSYAIGCGEIRGLGQPGHFGKGDFFVAEADEYVTDPTHDARPRFLWQKPEILVVTNIDYDHPDVYASLESVQDAFVTLQKQQIGSKVTIVNTDDEASGVLSTTDSVSYGFSQKAEYQITHIGFGNERTFVSVARQGMHVADLTLKVPGKHNALNALAAALVCKHVGLSWEEIAKGLLEFRGTKRRFEQVGTVGGVLVFDDYAHHPQEIMATLKAAREWYPDKRIIVVFQPHTYSRTKALLSDFSRAFGSAHSVVLTDIYASAREQETLGISGKTLVEETAKHHPHVYYAPDYQAVATTLKHQMTANDIIIFMGAGSIFMWGQEFIDSNK